MKEDRLKDLIRFLADLCMKQQKARQSAIYLKPEECKEYIKGNFPLIQGLNTINDLTKIGKQEITSIDNVKNTIKYMTGE